MNTIFKKLVWATVTIILCSLHSNAQVVSQKVGNNPTIIEPSAALEIESTSKAVLLPRVANTAAVTTPVNGMIVYDISSNCVKTYENGAWTGCLSDGASSSAVVTIDCANSSFSCAPKYVGTTGITVSFSIVNNSFTTVSAVDFSNAVTLSGAGAAGLTVTAGQNSSVSINSGATATLTYNLTGAPTTTGTLTALFSRLGLSCTVNSVVYGASGGNGMDGTTAANANLSCKSIKEAFPASTDGVYWIDPDGVCTGFSAMQAQCDMTTDGGGWTLIVNYVHANGTNPAVVARATFPLISSSILGTDESSTASVWGHSNNSLCAALSYSTLRFYGIESTHSRVVHFKTNHSALVVSTKTGGGTAGCISGWTATALSGHTATSVGMGTNYEYSGGGDNRFQTIKLYAFPSCGGSVDGGWSIGSWVGNGAYQWCVDRNPGSGVTTLSSTIHRVWAK